MPPSCGQRQPDTLEMESARTASRIIGALILTQMVSAAVISFVLEAPLFGTPGFLVNAAPHASQIALAAVFAIAALR